ncbi:MAG: hypothetical protein JW844_02305 [Candidatus Omnitrophica bacterium]|nr:hypothetical protein [Candidatus Omnitrophota bacterium]
MENAVDLIQKIEKIIKKDPRYKEEAYTFVLAALNYTVGKLPTKRHISGRELLEGIREYALNQFGPMTKTVLHYWGIAETLDFGNIVFHMIDAKLLGKSEEDSLEDFKNVFDFKAAFTPSNDYTLE